MISFGTDSNTRFSKPGRPQLKEAIFGSIFSRSLMNIIKQRQYNSRLLQYLIWFLASCGRLMEALGLENTFFVCSTIHSTLLDIINLASDTLLTYNKES
jgi:hypothetical protein